MPQHTRRKLRRKDLRLPDEFETLTGRALGWLTEHQRLLLGMAGAAAGVVVVAVIVGRVRASWNASAAEGFRGAYATFESTPGDAAEAFATVARDYPRAPFGRLAALYRAHALARRPDPAGAATAYTEYLATAPEPYLRQEALVGLGRAREASGDAAGALEAYGDAGALDGPYRADALLSAGRLHEAAGHTDQAREAYRELLKAGPDAATRAMLLQKLPPGSDTDPAAGGTAAATP